MSDKFGVTTKYGFRPIKYSPNDEFEINNKNNNKKTILLSQCPRGFFTYFSNYRCMLFQWTEYFEITKKTFNQFPGNVVFIAYHLWVCYAFFSNNCSYNVFGALSCFFYSITYLSNKKEKISAGKNIVGKKNSKGVIVMLTFMQFRRSFRWSKPSSTT